MIMKTKKILWMYLCTLLILMTGCNKNDDPIETDDKEIIPDETFQSEEFYSYLLEQFDTNKDGNLSIEEAKAVKEIKFFGPLEEKLSLKGIEVFPNLENLEIAHFVADTIDLSSASQLLSLQISSATINVLKLEKNEALKDLSIRYTDLPSLDLKSQTALESLFYSPSDIEFEELVGANRTNPHFYFKKTGLQILNVSHCTALKQLYCPASKITELDLSKNINLETLNISFSEISTIDLSKNSQLKTFYCIKKNDSQTKITELDISNNPKLELLDCFGNNIAKLNLNENSELKELYFDKNPVSYLNITNNPKLKKLSFLYSEITSLDIRNTWIEELSCSNTLQTLQAKGCKQLKSLTCYNTAELIDASESGLDTITYLPGYLPGPGGSSIGQKSHTLLLNNCPDLKKFFHEQYYTYPRGTVYVTNNGNLTIDISNCTSLTAFESNFIHEIKIDNCPNLKNFKAIGIFENVDFSGNINMDSIHCYTEFQLKTIDVSDCSSLKSLYSKASLTSIDLSQNKSLEELTLINIQLNNLDVDALTNLKHLELALSETNTTLELSKNNALETILIKDVSSSSYLPGDVRVHISGLTTLKEIKNESKYVLEMKINDCKNLGFISSKKYSSNPLPTMVNIKRCPSLKNVFLTYSGLTNFDISECNTLDTLDLKENKLTSVKINNDVKYLNSSYCELTSLDVSSCKSLQDLQCASNQISNLNFDGCTKLEILNCSENLLSQLKIASYSKLSELYCNNNRLSILDISKNAALDKIDCTNNADLKELHLSNKQTFSVFKKDSGTEIVYTD